MSRVRRLTSDDATAYGCAEATVATLLELFDLPDPGDATEAMALNGGIAYSGGTCGVITGAALALGRLAGARLEDRATAKRVTRRLVQQLMADFADVFGSTQCRDLTGFDLSIDHDGFLSSGVWERACMAQIEFGLGRIGPLRHPGTWESKLAELAGEDAAATEIAAAAAEAPAPATPAPQGPPPQVDGPAADGVSSEYR